uniref:Follistatin-like n=1 Tax=Callorhinchus milii TaxID=7868 RepID=A0A4W3IFF2_CALMI
MFLRPIEPEIFIVVHSAPSLSALLPLLIPTPRSPTPHPPDCPAPWDVLPTRKTPMQTLRVVVEAITFYPLTLPTLFPSETCEDVDCGLGKICKLNKHAKPTCICAPDCSNVTKRVPVCGTDGKIYSDECALLMAKCRGLPELEVQYQGECKKSCTQVLCPGSSMCVVDQTNSAHCVMCRVIPCPEPLSPGQALCGNNGLTYPSVCHLRRATCLLGKSIGVAHYGRCNSSEEDIKERGEHQDNTVFSKMLLGW